ncbi:Ada metal-binding domain-containing protein [uncultured Desulfobacter sp.]|uniref:Ada metal-binding domain-containing protein n=1 Tax=uncultured Desulfobacter sp. TaxID=240139 RepID=UPI002AAB987A|nr:Ada metal-binding domain-containing protein [uncultured Desulfobacter sp.]
MKKFIIGALVLLIGIPGFSFNLSHFLNFVAGVVPVLMILGGSLAVYLGIEELKQSDNSENQTEIEPSDTHKELPYKDSTEKSEDKIEPTPDTQIEPEGESSDKQEEAQPEEKAVSSSMADSQATEPPEPEEAAPEVVTIQFKGNIETLVFHSVTCNFASGKNCSMEFTTKEEAEAQGYKPCKICMPDD